MTPLEAHLLLREIHRLRDNDDEWAIQFDECEKGGYPQAPCAITNVIPGSSVAMHVTITTNVRIFGEVAKDGGVAEGELVNVFGNAPVGEDVVVRVRRHKMMALQTSGHITPRGLILHVQQVEDPNIA